MSTAGIRQKLWEKLGYADEFDLLRHLPRRHEDRSYWQDPFSVTLGTEVTVSGCIQSAKLQRWRGGRCRLVVILNVEPCGRELILQWFNMPFLRTSLVAGKRLALFGAVRDMGGGKRGMAHPEIEVLKEDAEAEIHLNRITPVYSLVSGVGQRRLRRAVHTLLFKKNIRPEEDGERAAVESEAGQSDRRITDPWRALHFPESWDELEAARRQLAKDELFFMQLLLARRRSRRAEHDRKRQEVDLQLVQTWQSCLPFKPTPAQSRAFQEIDADMRGSRPMNRLLQGDVGSGKTLVAAQAVVVTAAMGLDSVLLAPTETLARQHARNLEGLLKSGGVGIRLCTAAQRDMQMRGGRTLWVGTHALFQPGTRLPNIGLVVIDEQHKFGVRQRQALLEKVGDPDLLLMSATPIPRTLCLALYGDLDVSVLDELPPGRLPIRTVVRSNAQLPAVWDYVEKLITQGGRVYVVHPVLKESEKQDLKSAQAGYRELCKRFGEHSVVLLHGGLDTAEKDQRMQEFQNGRAHVMVATTVIEVGVDVPSASVMVIQNAARFGLAQLHQLRGRVGRGEAASYCVLVDDGESETAMRRLKLMEETQDGFKIAEADYTWRGPGDVLGTGQSGLPRMMLARWPRDMDLLPEARRLALELNASDPRLACHPILKRRVLDFESRGDDSLN